MLLLIEMVSRAVKVLCRKRLRQLMETLTYPLEQPYVEETVLLLNSVFGGDEKVWQTQILPYIAEYFGVSFGGVKPMHPSKAGRMDTGNDNNAEKSNLDVYEDLGSSQGSLSSSGVSEKKQIAPRSNKESESVVVAASPLPPSSSSSVQGADDSSGEDDEEQHPAQEKVSAPFFFVCRKSNVFVGFLCVSARCFEREEGLRKRFCGCSIIRASCVRQRA